MVEDDDSLRWLLRLTMERAGYRVDDAATGEDALAAAQGLPDLVLLNVDLPGVDGVEVCDRLKSGARTCAIPVLMVTGWTEDADRERGLRAGADAYVTKPFRPSELVARVRRELGG